MTIWKASAVAVAAVIAVGCSSDDDARPTEPRTVDAIQVRAETVEETFSQVGEIQPYHDTALAFRLNGMLASRLPLGQTVREGDVLAVLDKRPAETALRTARAELAAANAAMSLARLAAERQRTLLERNATARASVDEANANLATTQARVDAATVALEQAEDALSYTELRAPHEGTISAVQANQGEVVASGQVVLRLVTEERRHAVFDVPEVLYRTTPEDATIALQLVTDPGITAMGTIDEVAPLADPSTRAYRVMVAVNANAAAMPFGAPVLGTLVVGQDQLARLPASALTKSEGGSAVFVIDPQAGTVQRRSVEVARFDERFLYVSAGLADGDTVATTGVAKLRDGEQVLVREGAR
ncbi:efflux RND transporter periplasmic adaptor subunit [Aureimonas mangrovi]|uniref:efflux RND transporter periplasmic adaptor subunit n=1 Tax=Aureimonas mangrovi TaxID=2758041 RepID=UPI00163D600F|nr:efflux RND transporter periplasmic adaptor subunit [Aureimonas mangrovi]